MAQFGCLAGTRTVAPFAGAWIEILIKAKLLSNWNVAPFAGAWIEILSRYVHHHLGLSLPSRERGLKYIFLNFFFFYLIVAPFAGAWIEID